jgi:hypothetical protein
MIRSLPAVRLLILAGLCAVIFALPAGVAADEDKSGDALQAAKAWLDQIDSGKYEESYSAGSNALHDKVPENRWTLVLQTFRGLFGTVISRKESSHLYKPDGVDGLDGECMVIEYDTSFKKLPDAEELIVLRMEGGRWRGAGYNAGPKSTGQPDTLPPAETQTESHTMSTLQTNN